MSLSVQGNSVYGNTTNNLNDLSFTAINTDTITSTSFIPGAAIVVNNNSSLVSLNHDIGYLHDIGNQVVIKEVDINEIRNFFQANGKRLKTTMVDNLIVADDMDASEIVSGVFDPERIPHINPSGDFNGPMIVNDELVVFKSGTYQQIWLPFLRYVSSYQYEFQSSMNKNLITHIGTMTMAFTLFFVNDPPDTLQMGGFITVHQHAYRQGSTTQIVRASVQTFIYTLRASSSSSITTMISSDLLGSGSSLPVISVLDSPRTIKISCFLSNGNGPNGVMNNATQTTYHVKVTLNMDSQESFDTVLNALNITYQST